MLQVQSAIGLVVLLLIAWGVSEERRIGAWRVALTGIALQLVLAAAMLKVPAHRRRDRRDQRSRRRPRGGHRGRHEPRVRLPRRGAPSLRGDAAGRELRARISAPSRSSSWWAPSPPSSPTGGSSRSSCAASATCSERSFRLGGAVGLASAANIFIGMVEAPLFVRAYLNRLSRSDLFVLMATGMATIAGTVFVLYSIILSPVMPDAASQLLVASVISAPAAITIALLMVPPDGPPLDGAVVLPREDDGAMEAIVRGTEQGLKVFLSVVATLVVAVALVHLVNAVLGLLPELGSDPLTLQRIFSWPLTLVAWLLGIPWSEALSAADVLATKIVLNEFVAFLELAALPPETLSPRSRLVLVYAVCGFANFGSLGIMIGGLAAMVPERRGENRGARHEEHRGGALSRRPSPVASWGS